MILTKLIALCIILSLFGYTASANDEDEELRRLLEEESANEEIDTEAVRYMAHTFRAVRVINNHSVTSLDARTLDFRVNHRFGPLNSNFDDFFGLDISFVNLSFDYGITDRLMTGISRSSRNNIVDGYIRYNLLRQTRDNENMPITLTILANSSYTAQSNWDDGGDWQNRFAYVTQAIIGRKFSEKFSVQLMPAVIHKNLVDSAHYENTLWAAGVGVRYDLFTGRSSLTAEYFLVQPGSETAAQFVNPLSFGIDIETGGHVFQLHVTNASSMTEKAFLTETSRRWTDGDIFFGFNISRLFGL